MSNLQAKLNSFGGPRDRKFLWKRFYAFYIDLYIIIGIHFGLKYSYGSFLQKYIVKDSSFQTTYKIFSAESFYGPTLLITFFSYFILSYYLLNGKSVGKYLFSIRIVSDKENPHLSFRQVIGRTLGYFLCYATIPILLGVTAIRKNRRGIPEILSGTSAKNEALGDNEIHNEENILDFPILVPLAEAPAEEEVESLNEQDLDTQAS